MIIVGGGIAGLSAGWQLARTGRPVTVMDAGRVGSGASHAAAGYLQPSLSPGPIAEFEWESLRAFPAFVRELEAETRLDIDFRQDGLLRIAFPEDEEEVLSDFETRRDAGWDVELFGGTAIRELEPAISDKVQLACLMRDVSWVDGRKLCHALAQAIRMGGGTVMEDRPVTGLITAEDRVKGVRCGDTVIETEEVLLATGWTQDAIRGLPAELPVAKGVRGVILALAMDPAAPMVRHLIKFPGGILCPRSDGRLIAGVTRDTMTQDRFANAGAVLDILQSACRAVPACRSLPLVETTHAVRPYLADDTLYVGPSAQVAGLYYSLGHGSDGYLRAAGASAHLARAVLGGNEPALRLAMDYYV